MNGECPAVAARYPEGRAALDESRDGRQNELQSAAWAIGLWRGAVHHFDAPLLPSEARMVM